MRISVDKINELLNSKKRITITTHTNPDGDAIGSSFALYHYLLKHNHDVKVVTPNKHPEFLDWVPGIRDVEIFFSVLETNCSNESGETCKFSISPKSLNIFLDTLFKD